LKGAYKYGVILASQRTKTQARGFTPIGMVECWNIGRMGLGILRYFVDGPPKAERFS